jgi:hypothetical protein
MAISWQNQDGLDVCVYVQIRPDSIKDAPTPSYGVKVFVLAMWFVVIQDSCPLYGWSCMCVEPVSWAYNPKALAELRLPLQLPECIQCGISTMGCRSHQ